MRYPTVLLFGAPGSGKGTQGLSLQAAESRFYHFACGDVFRALDPNSAMGQAFAKYANGGGLVPDELTVQLWRETIDARIASGKFDPTKQILLLDGIPRSVEQARLMEERLDVQAIVYLECHNVQEIVNRLHARAAQSGRVDDTNEEVIRHRIDVYEEVTAPVLAFYPPKKVLRINAVRAKDVVTNDLLEQLKSRGVW